MQYDLSPANTWVQITLICGSFDYPTDKSRHALCFSEDGLVFHCPVPPLVLGIQKIQQKCHNGRANS